MSDEQRQESSSLVSEEASSVVDLFFDWYHVPALALVVAVMMAIRLESYDAFIRHGQVYFAGNDAWYHLRQVRYTVGHWPFTMPFDPMTNFPYGTNAGQFGTLYDQLVATVALVVGLGSPSPQLVAKVLLVAPPVFGALVAVPVYYIGERLGGRVSGLFGAAVLMLLPGTFLQRGLVGFADHNVVEPLFQTLAVLGLMVAISVAQREKPVWELIEDRDFEALRTPLKWSALAGVGVALYMWVWPPGVLLVGVFGTYLVYQLVSDYVNGGSPEPVAFAAVVAMVVAGLLMFVPFDTVGFSTTDFSLLQPTISFGVAAGAAFMAGLARLWDDADVDRIYYPVGVVGIIAVGVGLVSVALPSLFGTVVHNSLRFIGFSAGAATRTISEAQPYLAPDTLRRLSMSETQRILSDYGFTFFTGVAAAIWLVAAPLVRDGDTRRVGFAVGSLVLVGLLYVLPGPFTTLADSLGTVSELVGVALIALILFGAVLQHRYEGERLFVLIWAAFITSAAFTQVRFNYYLAPVVAVMNAYLLGVVIDYLGLRLPSAEAVRDVEGYQILAVLAVVMLVITPVLIVPMSVRNTGRASFDKSTTAWKAGQQNGPGAITEWDGSLRWMRRQTPAPGTLGGANNRMDPYGTYKLTDDYQYPEGAYGVQSWWDYGHWITVRGERIPNANPFQQGATDAANYLLAANESSAQQALGDRATEAGGTRYVMVDWQMVNPRSKFGAPVVWYDRSNVSQSDFYRVVYSENLRGNTYLRTQRYYDSLMVRLYAYHGSAMEPQPVVVDWEPRTYQLGNRQVTVRGPPRGNSSLVKQFDNMSAARNYTEQDPTSQIGGIGDYPTERVPALEHYRLVKVSNSSANRSASYQQGARYTFATTGVPPRAQTVHTPSWVKTFEHVPGATVTGDGLPANTTVRATVPMRVPTTNETFTYRQKVTTNENGEFTMTLPYSTTGYDQYGPKNGYTNVSVRATGPYTIETPIVKYNGSITQMRSNVSVSEGRVNGDVAGAKQVELEHHNPFENLNIGNVTSGGGNNSSSLSAPRSVTSSDGGSASSAPSLTSPSSQSPTSPTTPTSPATSSPSLTTDRRVAVRD
ncbi:MAG: oligosaccharyl transferase, archaeosortase A system-associated [Haloplanus sp.]